MRFMTACIALLCIAPLSVAGGSSHVPSLSEDRVVFPSGKELRIERYRVVHRDPMEALRAREPVTISQQVSLVNKWKRVLVIETQRFYEDEVKVLSIFDYDGNSYGELRQYRGDAKVLQKADRIFLAQKSAHHVVQESYILNPDGELVSTVTQSPNVFSFEVTSDQKFVGILSHQLVDGKPLVRVSVVRVDTGLLVGEFESYSEGSVEFTHGGKRYTIEVPTPQPPG